MNVLTHGEIAKQYAASVTEPIESKTPIMIQKAKKSDGYHYWFSHTGQIDICNSENYKYHGSIPEDEPRLCVYQKCWTPNGKKGYYAAYANYVEEYDMIEIASIFMLGNTGKSGETRKWTYNLNNWCYAGKRVFLFRGDKHLYDVNGNILWPDLESKYYNKGFRYFTRELETMKLANVSSNEFQKFAGTKNFQINRWTDKLVYPWSWNEWYKKCTPRPTSKTQAAIDDLLEVKLTSLKELQNKYPLICSCTQKRRYDGSYYNDYNFTAKDYFHFEIINDDYCVIRFLSRGSVNYWCSNDTVEEEFNEPFRIYISADGKVTIAQLIEKKYKITSSQIRTLTGWSRNTQFGNIDEIKNWKRLSWIEDIVSSNEGDKATLIVALLRHPILEIVYKAGYKNIFKLLLDDGTVAQNLLNAFGVKEKKKGSVTKLLGCNKQTLKWIDSHCNTSRYNWETRIVGVAKTIFGVDDISSWSQETIDMYFPPILYLLNKCGSSWQFELQLEETSSWRYNREEHEITEADRKRWQRILRAGKKDERILDMLLDTLRMYRNLNNKPDILDIFDINNAEDMMRYHDAIQELHNQQEAERRAYWNAQEKERLEQDKKKFEKLQEDRIKKFEYSNDKDNFVIRVPHDLAEITTEGQKLRHCVGGYLHRHAAGETNIIFLRRKDLPSIPFYTIEVQHDRVVQIHGFANCWLGKAPDAIKFVVEWLRKTGISCDNKILLETANGYGSSGTLLDAAEFGLA